MLISSLRALLSVQQRLPIAAAAALSCAWRGLAAGGGDATAAAASGASAPEASSTPGDEAEAAAAASCQQIISVDRSALFNPQPDSHDPGVRAVAEAHKEPETELARHLKALIRFRGGPLSLAEFMSEALTNPQHGYYCQRDMFGAAGDFVTSPEISQMMGEVGAALLPLPPHAVPMVGIWCVAAWQQLGCPPRLHLVELGPGRGTLMADLLRGTATFRQFSQAVRVSMVEVSPHLRGMQWHALRCEDSPPAKAPIPAVAAPGSVGNNSSEGSSSGESSSVATSSSSGTYSESGGGGDCGVSTWNGARVSWYRSLDEVVAEGGPALYIAHEFLDALPVHQFQHTERGWCERLVDVASPDSPLHLRMVLSPGPTPATRALLPRRLRQLPEAERRQGEPAALEVCPQAMALAESLAKRVGEQGGAALIIDYGQDGPYESSLQAIRQHQFVGLLEQPGTADLSNRVDYSALRVAVEESGAVADCSGPIPQALFLLGMGIQQRLEQLLAAATPEQAEALRVGYRRLVGGSAAGAALHEEGMGTSYQAFCISQRGLQPWPFGAVLEGEGEGEEGHQEEGEGEEEGHQEEGEGEGEGHQEAQQQQHPAATGEGVGLPPLPPAPN